MSIEEFEMRLTNEARVQNSQREAGHIVPFRNIMDLLQATVMLEMLKLLQKAAKDNE